MKKREKKDFFLKQLKNVYNDKDLNLSEETKKELIKQYSELISNKTNINYASFHLYPLIKNECYNNKSKILDDFLKLMLKYRWQSYFGMVLGSAFAGFR
ncbi:MAG: hypothetical protein PUG67_08825 [Peptoniphilaceae bacterium]|nr:hypothetical protein [Peptoniphilaceae bacterium]MDY6018344.1 hypothetical protein [Anaerococcus sp.]